MKSVEIEFASAVLIAFFLFWHQSGWYRVDCALGIRSACELIANEKDYHKTAEPIRP